MSDGLTAGRAGTTLPAGTFLVASLLGLDASAWLISAQLGTSDMRLGVLTRAPMMSGSGRMGMAGSMSMSVRGFLVSWTVMMVAMMVPSVLPAVRSLDTWGRATGQSGGVPVLFTVGYLLVWSSIGGPAYLVAQALQDWLPAANVTALRVGAVLLVVAGLYQLTPLKQACLLRCRAPRGSVTAPAGSRAQRYAGALHEGLWSGMNCLGSSWPLMLVLLLVGMMNFPWMGVIAGVIFVEKVLPRGAVISKGVGWGLTGWGVILLIAPHTVPSLGGV